MAHANSTRNATFMEDTSSLNHVYFFLEYDSVPDSPSSSSVASWEHVEVVDASTNPDSAIDTTSSLIRRNVCPSRSITTPLLVSPNGQPTPFAGLRAWIETKFPGLLNRLRTEEAALSKRVKEDMAFVWSSESIEDRAANEEWGDDWMYPFGILSFCLLCAIGVTLSRYDWTFMGVFSTLVILMRFFVLFMQFMIWLMVREKLKLDRNQKASFWAVRVFADGYWMWWMLESMTEILGDGKASTEW